MKAPFTATMFTSTKWDTAADKAKFANHFAHFVEAGMPETLFPKWFYTRLSMTFGHIAHFDRGGFYDTWFSDDAAKLAFLKHTIEWVNGGNAVGDPAFVYVDVERRLAAWVVATPYIDKLAKKVADANEAAERATLAKLKAKYEPAS
jgi:hypothetical protein